MIKRLKWNVLYAESAQDGSNLSDSSAESVGRGSTAAQAVLDQLATNDPNFATALGRQPYSSSSDGEGTHHKNNTAQYSSASEQEQIPNDSDDAEFAEWRECDICPGKRFLNDAEVETHLSSGRHRKALKRFEARRTLENDDNSAPNQGHVNADLQAFAALNNPVERHQLQTSSSSGLTGKAQEIPPLSRETQNTQPLDEADKPNANEEPEMTEAQQRKAKKRKAAVKRRLLRLKQKKWEKKGQDQGAGEAPTSQEEKQLLKKPIYQKGIKTELKGEKVRKDGHGVEEQRVRDSSGADHLGDDYAGCEGSPSSQMPERKKRRKGKGKETMGGNECNGSTKRKKLRRKRETSAKGNGP